MHRVCRIRAVSFDVGGTLIDPWPSVGHVYADVARKHGLDVSAAELDARFAEVWKRRRGFTYSRANWMEIVDLTFAGLTQVPPSQTFFEEIWARFDQPDAWRIYQDVLPTLKVLGRRGFRLAIISNWDERLRPLLGRLGLSKYFDAIVISVEVGFSKPAPEIFNIAARMLNLPPAAIIHVGDDPEDDFAGARAAGLSALLLDRSGSLPNSDTIRELTALCEILG